MKKAYLLLIVGLCLVALAMAAPDFSGTWVMNAEKSDQMGGRAGGGGGARGGGRGGMGGGEMVIKMSGSEMTVSQNFGGNSMDTVYTLDGAEHTTTARGGDLKYKATWSGETLTIEGTTTTQRGERPMKESYSLSADGKELTIASTRTGQQGETVTKRVYDKK
jgi:hypothetical protein